MLRTLKSFSALQWALAVSVLLHATALTVRLVNPEGLARAFQNTTLDVVLVNASSDDKPAQAQAIAQVNLAGGGDAADRRMVSTPLPRNEQDSAGNALITRNQRQIDTLQQEQQRLIAQVKAQLAAMPRPDPHRKTHDPRAQEQQTQRVRLSKLLAAIERRVNEENARPRTRYLAPATISSIYAPYYDAMRLKIEDRGTQNFPQVAGRKLYGELMMSLLVGRDGRVLDARVVESSGDRMLDRLAAAIAMSAGPFGPFTPAMRQDTDQLDVTARFRFTHEQILETQMQADVPVSQPPDADANGAP